LHEEDSKPAEGAVKREKKDHSQFVDKSEVPIGKLLKLELIIDGAYKLKIQRMTPSGFKLCWGRDNNYVIWSSIDKIPLKPEPLKISCPIIILKRSRRQGHVISRAQSF
jgi:hypothetical protein